MKIVSVVGTRPEFVQAAPVGDALRAAARHKEILVHTGQHYDYLMSQAFFEDLRLPAPTYNLGIGSESRARQTAAMLSGLEEVLAAERPDCVVVRGDTNSTLAGALAANELGIPLAHIEAGERSGDRSMPEEINRIITDRLADLHLCASRTAVGQLAAEGHSRSVHWVGDVMLDTLNRMRAAGRSNTCVLERFGLTPGKYALVTIHRAANTDDHGRLATIVSVLNEVREAVVFPVHPRTSAALDAIGAGLARHVIATSPVGYLDMLSLEEHARLIATDSGGVQREAYCLGVPCLTFREETEWVETVEAGWNTLVGADRSRILDAWEASQPSLPRPPIFGDGTAAVQIARLLDSLEP